MIKILTASLLGAVLCVLWSAISWMGLEWHATALHDFHDEVTVAAALKSNTEEELKRRGESSGVFILPRGALTGATAPKPEEPFPPKSSTAKKPADPSIFAFAIVRPGPREVNMGINMAWLFGRSLIACAIISFMLSWTSKLDYLQRVLFCVLAGVFATVVADAPLMVWFDMPLRYTFINFADHLCEWSLAGLVIALFVEGRDIWETIR